MTFILYTKPDCTFCHQAKALLDDRDITFAEQPFTTEAEFEDFRAMGFRTFPQIFSDTGQHIGGHAELVNYLGESNDDF